MTDQPGYQWEKVVDGAFAFAIWDASWNSFNDCYLVVDGDGLTLVDTGKTEHAERLAAALAEIGHFPDEVKTVLATHGHRDHIGGSTLFHKAVKRIQAADLDLLPQDMRGEFRSDLPSQGSVGNFDCVLLGQHTSGSVALFHRPTRVLFCGDHVSFFGRRLSAGQLVGPYPDVRTDFGHFVVDWRSDWPPSEEARRKMEIDLAQRPAQDQQRYDFDLFRQGLFALAQFEATALCTGHGPVLLDGIREFIEDLSRIQAMERDPRTL